MIRIFKDYYDKHGCRYKVLSYDSGLYACQSYNTKQTVFMREEDLFSSKPIKQAKAKFTDFVEEKKEEVQEIVSSVSEPVYEEPSYDEPVYIDEAPTSNPLKDNIIEETAGDFYADF